MHEYKDTCAALNELIVTQWDVNTDLKDNSANPISIGISELIVTQWDVNWFEKETWVDAVEN